MTDSNKFEFKSKVMRYHGEGAWYFVTLPKVMSDDIKLLSVDNTVGFGYVRVQVAVGRTIWNTTLFPSKEGRYYLAIKASVRKSENIADGDTIQGSIELISHNL